MRILDPARTKRHIHQLGLSPQENAAWDRVLRRQEGVVLVCGKTGSGKSVTLNAALHTIHRNDPTTDISTIEDPIEYQLEFRCTQHQVDAERDLTYVRLLTQFLRNDIDRVMVGEIRNAATCEAAYELAITGPQLLTTLHAANGYDAILRIQDFGLEPRKVSRLTRAVITQALVPTPCPTCARGIADGKLTPHEAQGAVRDHGAQRFVQEHLELYRSRNPDLPPDGRWVLSSREAGGGCDACRFTGYGGRHAAQEFLLIEKEDQGLVLNKDFETLEARQRARGFLSLQARIWEMAFRGLVPINAAADAAETA
jgi:type II secretory ATPase GspE/PulE/Tfp pilus assembly ATPase PilB-like protein